MDILPQVQNTIKRFDMFRRGDKVVVGVSGGPDSVALLDLMWRLREHLQVSIHVAHLNHCLREEAAGEAEFVQELAAVYDLGITVEKHDVPAYAAAQKLSTEVAARETRYRFFETLMRRIGATRVALGHQADDLAETVLLNFVRGAGLTGLKGIPPVRTPYVRPLIEVRRAAIEAYCAFRGLRTCLDASNLQTVYLRNRIRHELVPFLQREYNPEIVPALCRLAEITREEDEFMAGETAKALSKIIVSAEAVLGLKADLLTGLPPALARRVVRLAFKRVAGGLCELDFLHTEKVLHLLTPGAGREAVLPGGVRAVRSYDAILFFPRRAEPVPDFQRPVSIPGSTPVPELAMVLDVRTGDPHTEPAGLSAEEAVLDFDRVKPPVVVRKRRPGDVFHPLGFPAPVKLKDFLIGQKVPRHRRDRLALVEDALGIIWVAGLRVSARAAVTPDTKRYLHLRLVARPQGEADRTY
ncbi:MAG: tRNA lysidine(34) synthetase TilS [Ammonifex sp.]|nr:MAG: tRNA lysidine(34) synthetase TilS [Ammonifex sp.]